MALSLEDIAHLLATRGVNQYGREAVSQLEHALQCAQWAEKSGETPATVAAALLHDLGHLLAPGGDTAEQDDHCAHIYNKSLLYLVSNAFEDPARIPLFRDGVPILLGQVADAADDAEVRRTARKAMDAILRGVVATD